jgi:hypothetical protein
MRIAKVLLFYLLFCTLSISQIKLDEVGIQLGWNYSSILYKYGLPLETEYNSGYKILKYLVTTDGVKDMEQYPHVFKQQSYSRKVYLSIKDQKVRATSFVAMSKNNEFARGLFEGAESGRKSIYGRTADDYRGNDFTLMASWQGKENGLLDMIFLSRDEEYKVYVFSSVLWYNDPAYKEAYGVITSSKIYEKIDQ